MALFFSERKASFRSAPMSNNGRGPFGVICLAKNPIKNLRLSRYQEKTAFQVREEGAEIWYDKAEIWNARWGGEGGNLGTEGNSVWQGGNRKKRGEFPPISIVIGFPHILPPEGVRSIPRNICLAEVVTIPPNVRAIFIFRLNIHTICLVSAPSLCLTGSSLFCVSTLGENIDNPYPQRNFLLRIFGEKLASNR